MEGAGDDVGRGGDAAGGEGAEIARSAEGGMSGGCVGGGGLDWVGLSNSSSESSSESSSLVRMETGFDVGVDGDVGMGGGAGIGCLGSMKSLRSGNSSSRMSSSRVIVSLSKGVVKGSFESVIVPNDEIERL